jgi:hypothetical protein
MVSIEFLLKVYLPYPNIPADTLASVGRQPSFLMEHSIRNNYYINFISTYIKLITKIIIFLIKNIINKQNRFNRRAIASKCHR